MGITDAKGEAADDTGTLNDIGDRLHFRMEELHRQERVLQEMLRYVRAESQRCTDQFETARDRTGLMDPSSQQQEASDGKQRGKRGNGKQGRKRRKEVERALQCISGYNLLLREEHRLVERLEDVFHSIERVRQQIKEVTGERVDLH